MRRLVIDGVIGQATYPGQGVAAGSPTAPFELALATLPTIVRLRATGLPIVITVHVDDYLMSGTGKSDQEVVEVLVQGADVVHAGVSEAGFVLEFSKRVHDGYELTIAC